MSSEPPYRHSSRLLCLAAPRECSRTHESAHIQEMTPKWTLTFLTVSVLQRPGQGGSCWEEGAGQR